MPGSNMNTRTTQRPRVLLIEHGAGARRSIASALQDGGYEVFTAGAAAQGLALVRQVRPSVVMMDVDLPDRPGLDLCREIRRHDDRVGIIILGDRSHEADAVTGLAAGADDFLVKPLRLRELVARVEATLRRVRLTSPPIRRDWIAFEQMTIDVDARRVLRDGREVGLTHTEFDLLLLLATNAGRAVSREAILQAVWSQEDAVDIATRVIDVHIRNLRKKLEPRPSSPLYILAVPGIGYRFTNARPPSARPPETP